MANGDARHEPRIAVAHTVFLLLPPACRPHTCFTSATSFVSVPFASPNSICVFAL
jgi:hypothetical protein